MGIIANFINQEVDDITDNGVLYIRRSSNHWKDSISLFHLHLNHAQLCAHLGCSPLTLVII